MHFEAVHTHITKSDLVKFNVRFMATNPYTYRYMGLVALAVLIYLVYKRGMPDEVGIWMLMVIGSLFAGLAATIVYALWCILTVLMVSKESNGILGKHEYLCTEDGLFEKTIANETLYKWGALGQLRVAGSYLLLQVSGFQYHIFPLRSFDNPAQMDAFQQHLSECINTARQ